MAVIINDSERGLLFKNGRFVKMLEPGRYAQFFGRTVEKGSTKERIDCSASRETLLSDPRVAAATVELTVPDGSVGLHFLDGVFTEALGPGSYLFWNVNEKHTFITDSTDDPRVGDQVPASVFDSMSPEFFIRAEIPAHMKARLYLDGSYSGLLDSGVYYFWRTGRSVDWETVDTRLLRMDVNGQEMLTADKVTLRVNFVLSYRITDPVRIGTEVEDYEDILRMHAQLALRDYVGRYKLDEILDDRQKMADTVCGALREKAPKLFIEIEEAGVRDVIIPGEIREIMNTVLMAEKKAQANVITRREEVASTRSLLNTAKLMDENETLYRLKEMEYAERIFENVGSITLNGSGSALEQVLQLLNKK